MTRKKNCKNSPWIILCLVCVTSLKPSPWEFIGPDTVSFTAMHNWGNGHLIAATYISGVGKNRPLYYSRDYGKTWDTLCMGGGLERYKVSNFMYNNHKLYACLLPDADCQKNSQENITFYVSLDSGSTWDNVDSVPGYKCFWSIGKDSTIIVGHNTHVSKSIDDGKTWRKIEVKDSLGGVLVCYSAAMYNDTIYVGCYQGLWVSKDWGETWQNRGPNIITMYSIDFVGNIIYFGCQAGLAYHNNFGSGPASSWIQTLAPGSNYDTWACTINDSIVYAKVDPPNGQKSLLYCSYDTVKTFQQFWLENDTSKVIYVNKFFSDGIYVFALTNSGIYRKLINDVSLMHKPNKTNTYPISIQQRNNQIILYSNNSSRVSLSINSINGRLIKNIINNERIASSWSYPCKNLKNITASGLYLLIVKSDNKMYTTKIFLSD